MLDPGTQGRTAASIQQKDRNPRRKQMYGWLIDADDMNSAPERLALTTTAGDEEEDNDPFDEFMWDLELKVRDIVESASWAMVWDPETRDYSRFLGVDSEPPPDQLEALRVAITESSLTIGEPGWYYLR